MIADSPQGRRLLRLADDLPGGPGSRRPARGRRARPVRGADPVARGAARCGDHRLGHSQRRGGARQRRTPRPAIDPDPGHARGARVDGRVPAARGWRGDRDAQPRADGRRRGPLLARRVRARPAVRRPGVDRPAQRRGARRRGDASGARCADRPPQPWRVPARPRRAREPGAAVHAADAGPRRVQGLQRLARPSRRRCAPRPDRRRHGRVDPERRPGLPLRRRRVRCPAPGRHVARGARGHRADPGSRSPGSRTRSDRS